EVERTTGQRVPTYGVRSGARPGRSQVRGNTLSVYRPQVNQRTNERPQRVVKASENRAAPANGNGRAANTRTEAQARLQNTKRALQSRNVTREPAASNRAARAPQQQQHITERRQQSWQQQRSESSRQDNTRATAP